MRKFLTGGLDSNSRKRTFRHLLSALMLLCGGLVVVALAQPGGASATPTTGSYGCDRTPTAAPAAYRFVVAGQHRTVTVTKTRYKTVTVTKTITKTKVICSTTTVTEKSPPETVTVTVTETGTSSTGSFTGSLSEIN